MGDEASAPRIAAISGGSSGIGRAVGEAFAELGWKVALGARGEERLRAAEAELESRGAAALGARLDVTDPGAVAGFYDACEATLGPVDVVVSCAAHARPGPLHELSPEQIRSEVESGLVGSLLFAREGIRRLLARGARGDVVFVSSTSAETPWPLLSAYAGSKAGLEQSARSLGRELEGTGVRVTVVRVGNTVGTSWTDAWGPEEFAATAEWQRHGLLRHGGLLAPAQVARSIAWVVRVPRSVHLDFVSMHPEAPAGG